MNKRRGQVFKAITNVMSNGGYSNICRLRFTLTHAEMRPVLEKWKEVRENDGNNEMLRCTSDNPPADRNEMEKIYPTLLKNVKRYREPAKDYPRATLETSKIVLATSRQEANNIGCVLMAHINDHYEDAAAGSITVAVDTEWNAFDNTRDVTRVLQVSVPRSPCVHVFHLSAMGELSEANFPDSLKSFLEDRRLRACGVNIGIDLSRLEKLGVVLPCRLELRQLSETLDGGQSASLAELSKRHLGVFVDKSDRLSDWSQNPLPEALVQYAALDAVLSRLCAKSMMKKSDENPAMNVGQLLEDFNVDAEVQFVSQGKVLAKGIITVVGNERGNSQNGASCWLQLVKPLSV